MRDLEMHLTPTAFWNQPHVRDLLTPDEWIYIVDETARAAAYKCEHCESDDDIRCCPKFEKILPEGDTGRAKWNLIGFRLICKHCLDVVHIGRARKFGSGDRFLLAKERMMRLNGISEDEASDKIKAAFRSHARERAYRWSRDLSYITVAFGFKPKVDMLSISS